MSSAIQTFVAIVAFFLIAVAVTDAVAFFLSDFRYLVGAVAIALVLVASITAVTRRA